MRLLILAILLIVAMKSNAELPKGFVYLKDLAPDIPQDIRYAGHHNFMGRPADGYLKGECILTRKTAEALVLAQKKVVAEGYSLKVFDCYRPQKAVDDFKKWSKDLKDRRAKSEFYRSFNKENLFKAGFLASRSGHSSGSKVDVTLIKLPYGGDEVYYKGKKNKDCAADYNIRYYESNVDMGTNYDCFHKRSYTDDRSITKEAQKNREYLKRIMVEAGFKNYRKEWWDFKIKNAEFEKKYFNFDVR